MKQAASEPVKDVKVDREEFGAAISKLLQTSPISKPAISQRVKLADRRRRYQKPLLDQQ
jgi:hypothetical protein